MIYISAGHHSTKRGASYRDFFEYDEALAWVDLILAHLGTTGTRVPPGVLRNKVDFINNGNASFAIEIHFNSAIDTRGNRVGRGSETLYYPGSKTGMRIAESIQDVLAKYFPPSRGVKEGWYKMNKKNGPDFFLAKTICPAVILEPEFVHNYEVIREKRGDVCKALAVALSEIVV